MRENAKTQRFDVSGFKTREQAKAEAEMQEHMRTPDGWPSSQAFAEKPADLGDDMIGEAFDLYAED